MNRHGSEIGPIARQDMAAFTLCEVMAFDAVEVGLRIRELREERGWTQRLLARKTVQRGEPVSHGTVSQIEQGGRKRPSPSLEALVHTLGWPTWRAMMEANHYASVTNSVDFREEAAEYLGANDSGGAPRGVITKGWPVYGWETAGDPLAGEETQQPLVINTLPFVREVALVAGPRTFALQIGDETLTHWEWAEIGSWCVVDPDKAAKPDHLVCCRIRTLAGAWRLIIRELKVAEDGHRTLITAGRQSAEPVNADDAQLIGLVVKVVNVAEPKKRDLNDDMESFVQRIRRPDQIVPRAG